MGLCNKLLQAVLHIANNMTGCEPHCQPMPLLESNIDYHKQTSVRINIGTQLGIVLEQFNGK